MDEQDDVDTAPIIPRDGVLTEHGSALVGPGELAEIVLEPEEPMRSPVLFISLDPRDGAVTVERVDHGDDLVLSGSVPAARYKLGLPLRLAASRERPIKIYFTSQDMRAVRVGASLVAGEERRPDGTYHLRGDEIEERPHGKRSQGT